MPRIPFTQYLMPDGRTREITINCSEDIHAKAMEIIKNGYRLEAEMLRTGEISLTVFHIDEEEDVEMELVPNGPEVPLAVDRLITRFYEESLEAQDGNA